MWACQVSHYSWGYSGSTWHAQSVNWGTCQVCAPQLNPLPSHTPHLEASVQALLEASALAVIEATVHAILVASVGTLHIAGVMALVEARVQALVERLHHVVGNMPWWARGCGVLLVCCCGGHW
jgi:hypothetical protein